MRTIPAVRVKATVNRENSFVERDLAFAAVERILSSAVPSAPLTDLKKHSLQDSLSPINSSPASRVFLPILLASCMVR